MRVCIRVIPSRLSCNFPAPASSGLQRGRSRAGATCCGAAWRMRPGVETVYLRGLGGGGALALWAFSAGASLAGAGRGGAARGSSRGTPKRSGSETAVLLQRPGGGGGGGGEGCGGDSSRNRRCPRGAAAGLAAARTAAEGPAGRGAEQPRHGKRGWRRRCCSGASSSRFRSGSRPAGTRPSLPRGAGPGGRGSKARPGAGAEFPGL